MAHSQVRSFSAELPLSSQVMCNRNGSTTCCGAVHASVRLHSPAARAAASHWWAAEGNLEQRPHRLQRWFAAAAFLTLVPQSYSGRVLAASVRTVLRQPW